MNSITPIGATNWHNQNRKFGIKDEDRLGHIYVIGKTGVGKSTLLYNMACSDIQKGKGLAVIDPHGDIAEKLYRNIPEWRKQDVIYFNPETNPIAFNPLKAVHPNFHHLVASGIVSTFKKIWADSWGPRLEYILRYSVLTLLHLPDATLLDIKTLLTNYDFRRGVLDYVNEPHIKAFWEKEYDKYSPKLQMEAISPILNKAGIFNSSKPLRDTIGKRTNGFRMKEVMDESKILIANLSKGTIGEDASTLLGSFLVNAIQLEALYRARQPEETRRPFFLYVDECHSFINQSFADILSEARKYKLGIFLAHQYIEQLPEEIRSAVFGNVGTLISFRVGATDAEYLAKEFQPEFTEEDLVNLPKYHMYLKLMIDEATSKPFSALTLLNKNKQLY